MDVHTQIKGQLDRVERKKGICIVPIEPHKLVKRVD